MHKNILSIREFILFFKENAFNSKKVFFIFFVDEDEEIKELKILPLNDVFFLKWI